MPAIFFAGQVDGVRSLPRRATADATQDAAQVAAKTEVGCTQPGVVANHPEHRVDARGGDPAVLVHAGERARSEPDVVAA
eukprot:COSAG02_NODE_2188_length_9569_cov_21.824710_11_plen_80_part_00